MQAGQLTIPSQNVSNIRSSSVTGKLGHLMARVFGCWHTELSRPFSQQGHAYRVCLKCGAQRQFNLGNWQMQGNFYYHKPTTKQFQTFGGLAAVRRVTN